MRWKSKFGQHDFHKYKGRAATEHSKYAEKAVIVQILHIVSGDKMWQDTLGKLIAYGVPPTGYIIAIPSEAVSRQWHRTIGWLEDGEVWASLLVEGTSIVSYQRGTRASSASLVALNVNLPSFEIR